MYNKFFASVALIALSVGSVAGVSDEQLFNESRTRVQQLQQVDPTLPSGVDSKGTVGEILSRMFNTNGSIRPIFVADLPATKITTGQFDAARIPNLDASKITTGNFDFSRISNVVLTSDMIPNLDATKITTGNFDFSRIANVSITSPMIADNAITTNKIANNAVNSLKIADNSIGNTEIINTESFTMRDITLNNGTLSNPAINLGSSAVGIYRGGTFSNQINFKLFNDNAIEFVRPNTQFTQIKTPNASDYARGITLSSGTSTGNSLSGNSVLRLIGPNSDSNYLGLGGSSWENGVVVYAGHTTGSRVRGGDVLIAAGDGSTVDGMMSFITGNEYRMRITDTGNIGIGTTTPTQRLDVTGNVRATAFLYASDKNLKTNITPYSDGKRVLAGIEAKKYNWKDTGKSDIGVIAQDVQEVFPEAVSEGVDGMLAVDYAKLIVPLIQVVQDQQKEIEAQSRRLDLLESQIQKLTQAQ